MDSTTVDINKLLLQLEELKRKKARSEKKLKKLAKCVPKVKLTVEEKKVSHDCPHESKAVCIPVDNINKENLEVSKDSTTAICSACNIVPSHSSFLSSICVCKKPDQLKTKKSPLSSSDFTVHNEKRNNCSQEIYDLDICKDMQKTANCELLSDENSVMNNFDSISSNEPKMNANHSRKRPSLEYDSSDMNVLISDVRKKQKVSDVSSSRNDIESEDDVEIIPLDIKTKNQKVIEESCLIPGTLNEVDLDSNKCHRSSSQCAVECFDNEMTCSLSSQVMDCRGDVTGKKCPESVANGPGLLSQSLRTSELSFSDSLQCSYTNFELPKFSSPTDLCTSNKTKQQNDVSSSDHCVLKSENCEVSHESESRFPCSPEKTFSHSKLKHILGSELSSVLDAHYKSPGKTQENKGCKNSKSVGFQNANGLGESAGMQSVLLDDSVMELTFHDVTSPVIQKNEKGSSEQDKHASPVEVIDVGNDDSVLLLPSSKKLEIHDFSIDPNINDTQENHGRFKKDSDFSHIIRESSFCKNSDHLNTNLQVSITIDALIHQVCKLDPAMEVNEIHSVENSMGNNFESDSEVLVIPETEFFGSDDISYSEIVETTVLPDTQMVEETSQILESESHNRTELPKVDQVSDDHANFSDSELSKGDFELSNVKELADTISLEDREESEKQNCYPESEFMETNLFDAENSQELGSYKSISVLQKEGKAEAEHSDEVHAEENNESHLAFACCLSGNYKESVSDLQMVVFNDNTYVFAQFLTYIEVWRHQVHEDWLKIFVHHVDDALELKKLSLLKNKDHLLLVLLLSSREEHCLQFVLFERNSKVIKVLENSHWLNEGQPSETVLLCDLNGLMFATAQGNDIFKVYAHCFADLSDSPRLISLELGSTTDHLCSICKIKNLPNALLGISQGTLYVWHLLEARLVTAVTLQPQDYLPVTECIWATVEKGLLLFITTTQDENNLVVSQLLAANLATGFCQIITPFDIRPASLNEKDSDRTVKAKYCEPYLIASYKHNAFLWSVMDEHCCAALDRSHSVTAVAIGRDIDGHRLLALGNERGCVNFYVLN